MKIKAKKQLFGKGFVISEDELKRLNLLLSQLDLLNRWLASDKRSQIILNTLNLAREGKYCKEPYQIRDELLAFDKRTEITEFPKPTQTYRAKSPVICCEIMWRYCETEDKGGKR